MWRCVMAKYLITASYSAEGTKGLLKDGGSNRKDAVAKVIEGKRQINQALFF